MTSSFHAPIFLEKDYSESPHSIRNTNQKPTVQKLFDVTQRLISEQKLEISGVSELSWGTSTCETLSLVNDEEVIKLMKAKVYIFSDLYSSLELCENSHSLTLDGKTDWNGLRALINTENWMESMENQWSSSGRYSQDTPRCRSSKRSKN